MEILDVGTNDLEGSVDLTRLPANLRKLCLSCNRFSQDLCLNKLPATLEELSISKNVFCGTLEMRSVPPALQLFDAEMTSMSGCAVFGDIPDGARIWMSFSGRYYFDGVHGLNGETHPREQAIRKQNHVLLF